MRGGDVAYWPEVSVRCVATTRPESEVKPTSKTAQPTRCDPMYGPAVRSKKILTSWR
jgi:hypothetical protein